MIFYAEDDTNIRELVLYTLQKSGFAARGFADGAALMQAMRAELPDLVLLDVMLPGEDGVSLLRRLRADGRTRDLPIMLITARGAEFDKVLGLDSGADDYLTKPFGMMELVARVRALLRRSGRAAETAPADLTFGGIRLSPAARTVTADGAPVTLTKKEFDLLTLLMSRPGRAFTRDALLEQVWGYDYEGGTRTVDVHIQTLRQKLGPCGRHIETLRGVGYRLGDGV